MPLDQFFKGPGLTALEPGEILTAIRVPVPPAHSGASYQHVSARGRVDISAVCVGAMAVFDGETCREARIVLGAVAPTPMRALEAESLVRGKPWTLELDRKGGEEGRRRVETHHRCAGQRRVPEANGRQY